MNGMVPPSPMYGGRVCQIVHRRGVQRDRQPRRKAGAFQPVAALSAAKSTTALYGVFFSTSRFTSAAASAPSTVGGMRSGASAPCRGAARYPRSWSKAVRRRR